MRTYYDIDLSDRSITRRELEGEAVVKAGRYFIAKTLLERRAATVEPLSPANPLIFSAGPFAGTSFSNTGLTAGTSYSYRVRAADAAGNLSTYSNVATASTAAADITPPTAPANLGASAAGAGQINLSWAASTDNVGVTGYQLERCQGAGCVNFALIATPAGTTFSDSGLAGSASYSYRVRAGDAAGNPTRDTCRRCAREP